MRALAAALPCALLVACSGGKETGTTSSSGAGAGAGAASSAASSTGSTSSAGSGGSAGAGSGVGGGAAGSGGAAAVVEEVAPLSACGVARDGAHVYWSVSDGSTNSIQRVAYAGGPLELVVPDAPDCAAVAVDGAQVYLAVETNAGVVLYAAPKTGGALSQLGTAGSSNLAGSAHLAVVSDGVQAYWMGPDGIHRVPVGGGAPELWVKTSCLETLVLDGASLYWSCYGNSRIATRAISDGPVLDGSFTIVTQLPWLRGFTLDSTSFYLPDFLNGIQSVPKQGGAESLVEGGYQYYYSVDVDSQYVLYGAYDGNDRLIARAPKQGGAAKTIAFVQINDLVVEAGPYVYAAGGGTGIYRVLLP